jgi:hypothetical protein
MEEIKRKDTLRSFIIDNLIKDIPKDIYSSKEIDIMIMSIMLNLPENVWISYTKTQNEIANELIINFIESIKSKKSYKKEQEKIISFIYSLIDKDD